MAERANAVTFKGNPLTLLGNEVKVGDRAPDVTLLTNDLQEKNLASYFGKPLIVSSVPSLDTPVCDSETRRFNEEAGKLGDGVEVVTVSMDLPFAQARWCSAKGVENVVTLSDHRDAEFGSNWGVLIKELRLLARSVWVLDSDGVVKYVQLVGEVADEPDYDEVLTKVRELV